MASRPFNISKGRVNEFQDRVAGDDPVDSGFVLMLLEANESDDLLDDRNDFADILGAPANTESVAAGYARIVLTDATVSASVVNDTANLRSSDIADPTFPSLGPGNDTTKLIMGYDVNTTLGGDSGIIPTTHHDFATALNGSDIVGQVNAGGYFSAS